MDVPGLQYNEVLFVNAATGEPTNGLFVAKRIFGVPGETSNLAQQHPALAREGRERLAAWVQYQDRFYRRVLPGPDPDR
jgi:hypothetical protein